MYLTGSWGSPVNFQNGMCVRYCNVNRKGQNLTEADFRYLLPDNLMVSTMRKVESLPIINISWHPLVWRISICWEHF